MTYITANELIALFASPSSLPLSLCFARARRFVHQGEQTQAVRDGREFYSRVKFCPI